MLPDLTPQHAIAITTCLVCLLVIVALGHWLDTRARKRADRIAADEDAADALVRAYGLNRRGPAPEPGEAPMTIIDGTPPRAGETLRDYSARLARARAARHASTDYDPFKNHSRRAHLLYPEPDDTHKPPRPWHIGDNPGSHK